MRDKLKIELQALVMRIMAGLGAEQTRRMLREVLAEMDGGRDGDWSGPGSR